MNYLSDLLQADFPIVYEWLNVFLQSSFFTVVKFILGFYSVILLLDIVMILLLRDIRSNLKEGFLGMKVPATPRSVLARRWDRIKKRTERRDVSQYKVAILEADKFIDEVVGAMGIRGKDLGEKLANVHPGHFDNLEELKAAHQVRNRVLHEAGFDPDEQTTKKIIAIFDHLIRNNEFI